MDINLVVMIIDVLMNVNGTTKADVVIVIDVDKANRTTDVLRRLEAIDVSRKHTKLRLRRMRVILPAKKRVIHLLLPERMYLILGTTQTNQTVL